MTGGTWLVDICKYGKFYVYGWVCKSDMPVHMLVLNLVCICVCVIGRHLYACTYLCSWSCTWSKLALVYSFTCVYAHTRLDVRHYVCIDERVIHTKYLCVCSSSRSVFRAPLTAPPPGTTLGSITAITVTWFLHMQHYCMCLHVFGFSMKSHKINIIRHQHILF